MRLPGHHPEMSGSGGPGIQAVAAFGLSLVGGRGLYDGIVKSVSAITMRFMLLLYSCDPNWSEEEWTQFVGSLPTNAYRPGATFRLVEASVLSPPGSATTVRVRDSRWLAAVGPVSRDDDAVRAYCLIEVEDGESAVAVARRLQAATRGAIEVREVQTLEGLPREKMGAERIPNGSSKFIFLCHDDEGAWERAGPEALRDAMREAVALTHRLDARGMFLGASPLQPSATAATVRARDRRPLLTSGPYAETREVLGGYYLILAADQEQAVGFAAQHPGARLGAVEVRAVRPTVSRDSS